MTLGSTLVPGVGFGWRLGLGLGPGLGLHGWSVQRPVRLLAPPQLKYNLKPQPHRMKEETRPLVPKRALCLKRP